LGLELVAVELLRGAPSEYGDQFLPIGPIRISNIFEVAA
jgi:hypothetical protein